jgi:fumarate hydratase class II
MGEMQVPVTANYGASTQRARENFPISNLRFNRRFIKALGLIKLAQAKANVSLGLIESDLGKRIADAAQEVADGKWDNDFVVDIFQTGSGTSTNMNANEIIGRLAHAHPNDHVNLGQSSNDVIPATIHLAALITIKEELDPALLKLVATLAGKKRAFNKIVKTGRTHLQDATPVTLGQEFSGYEAQMQAFSKDLVRIEKQLASLALGGTAVGNGINTIKGQAALTIKNLSGLTGLHLKETSNHFRGQSTIDDIVATSSFMRALALSLLKVINDIRYLASGPRAGYGELTLPAVQPGSSIMPGKVNPVIIESAMQVCYKVIGNDATIAFANQASNFELNTALPVTAYCLLESIELLAAALRNLDKNCLAGLTATKKGPQIVENGLALCTALAPVIGYDLAAAIAKEASARDCSILEVALTKTSLSEKELREILDPHQLAHPHKTGKKK